MIIIQSFSGDSSDSKTRKTYIDLRWCIGEHPGSFDGIIDSEHKNIDYGGKQKTITVFNTYCGGPVFLTVKILT